MAGRYAYNADLGKWQVHRLNRETGQVDAITAGQIRNGRDFRVSPFQAREGTRYVKAVTPQGELVAIGEARLPHIYHPVLVL